MIDNDQISFRIDSYTKQLTDRILKEEGNNHSAYLRSCLYDLIDKDERRYGNSLVADTIKYAKKIGKEVSKIYDEYYRNIVK